MSALHVLQAICAANFLLGCLLLLQRDAHERAQQQRWREEGERLIAKARGQ